MQADVISHISTSPAKLSIGTFEQPIIAGTGTGLTEAAEIIGAEIGIPGSVVEGFIMSGLTIVVDQLVMLIARHTPLGEVWQKIKDFFNTKILKR